MSLRSPFIFSGIRSVECQLASARRTLPSGDSGFHPRIFFSGVLFSIETACLQFVTSSFGGTKFDAKKPQDNLMGHLWSPGPVSYLTSSSVGGSSNSASSTSWK
ncbi:wsv167 [White spot syndrome virus]|uniref:Wsv167 n=4 Tax=White spot syndrome virus TaxID=342409 RepID=Q8VB32_WSSVS|nr:wsv167 [Shrimp white spot syndrome virus]AFX59545.1 wsv167 [White spot syndrome virus]AAL33171.1 wsv167 [Shrimp white spot syndrome virus]AAL89091.1 WSSV223 [Shrimp white spot syndrome virus]AWQ60345.1 wsv167 [Shrimp white spot syndrome virus]AWQ60758.1 wsv167 [Shrimp white spot syndrome virus]